MSNQVFKLMQEATQQKKNGDFVLAMASYMEALNIEPTSKEIYQELGKVTYLMKDAKTSVLAYLSYMHLEMYEVEKQIYGEFMPTTAQEMYDSTSDAIRDVLPKKSGIMLFNNNTMIRHMSRTLLDHDPKRPKEFDGLVEIYSAQLQGKSEEDRNFLYEKHGLTPDKIGEIERKIYLEHGLRFMLDKIQWNEISDNNVLRIYFKDAEKLL